jgi:HEAT repeat protein
MGRSLEARWRTIVRSALTSDDPEIRFEAARALGMIGTSDDVAELSELTLEEDTDVRQAAITALGEIGGPGAVRVLRNLAQRASEGDKEAVDDALDAALLANDPLRFPT